MPTYIAKEDCTLSDPFRYVQEGAEIYSDHEIEHESLVKAEDYQKRGNIPLMGAMTTMSGARNHISDMVVPSEYAKNMTLMKHGEDIRDGKVPSSDNPMPHGIDAIEDESTRLALTRQEEAREDSVQVKQPPKPQQRAPRGTGNQAVLG